MSVLAPVLRTVLQPVLSPIDAVAGGGGSPGLQINGTPSPATYGVAYSWTPSIGGGTAPYTVAVTSGSLPAWASLNTTTGEITGTPDSTTQVSVTLTVTDAVAATDSLPITVNIAAVVPGAPTIGTATAGDAQADVAFTAPASDGGSAITGYRATSTPGGITATGASSPITVTGLTNGTAYTFTVAAQNAVGYGAESASSNSVTPSSASLESQVQAFFSSGETGGMWRYKGMDHVWQDDAGTTAVTATGQTIGRVDDLSGNGNHATQATSSYRPQYQSYGALFDKSDDRLLTASLGAMATGTLMIATDIGTLIAPIRRSAGVFSVGTNNPTTQFPYTPSDKIVAVLIISRALSSGEKATLAAWATSLGAGAADSTAFAGVTSMSAKFGYLPLAGFPMIDTSSATTIAYWFLNNSVSSGGLDSFPLVDLSSVTTAEGAWYSGKLTSFPACDMSACTNFKIAWSNCNLTSFPAVNMSAGNNFNSAWSYNGSMTTFPAGRFNSMPAPANDCFGGAWSGCSALTNTSVENILVSIDASGRSAPASGTDITINYDGTTLSGATNSAITSLKGKGWTPKINGVYV